MKALVIGLVLCSMSMAVVWGQVTAQIHGTVQDATGSAVPGAQVVATQTDTRVARTVTSGADGGYVITNLPLGPYQLEVTKEGFTKSVQAGVVLDVGSDPAIAVALKVGAVNEQVTVEATATQVETRSVGVGTIVENTQRVLDLPLNGRQPTDLISLGGAAVVTSVAATYLMNGAAQISVAGGNAYSVQFNLDGASHLDTYAGYNMPLPFPDALQEFRLVTSTQDASGGGHSAASVNAVTKSGTNSFHGDAFEFFRNGDLNGRDFFAASNDHLKRNQFGGVFGGPIKKDKIFFFLGYQGTLIRQTPSNSVDYVPTPAMRTGDFSAYMASHCPESTKISPTALTSTDQLVKPLNASALDVAAQLPTPINACGEVLTGNPLHQNQLQAPVRVDYQINDKQTLFVRYMISRNEITPAYALAPNNLLTANGQGNDDTAQSLAFGHTYVISPTLVNSFRIFGNRMGEVNDYKPELSPSGIGIQNFSTTIPNFLDLTVLSDFGVGYPIQLISQHYSNFGVNEDLNLVRGSHQISIGGMFMQSIINEYSDFWVPGSFTFGGLSVAAGGTGSPLADFLTGTVENLHQYSASPDIYSQNAAGLYASDTWKINSRLTMNYGVRWNPYIPQNWLTGYVENFSLSQFYANAHSTVLPSAPPGFTFPGDPGFPGKTGVNYKWDYFEPRIGLAFDPVGDGKTVIRANAGLAHDFIYAFPFLNADSVAPFTAGVNLNGPLNFSNPWATVPGGDPFPYAYNKSAPFPTYPQYQGFYPFQPNLPETVQQSWGLAIQRQITNSFFASATYIGTHLIHTWDALEMNPAQFIPGTCAAGQYGLTAPGPCSTLGNENQRRILELTNPAGAGTILGSMDSFDNSGTQTYNGLLLSATYRKGNTSISGNYTWSHCYGMPFVGTTNNGSSYENAPYQNNGPQNRYLDYGDCATSSLDIRQVANITIVTSTPKFSNTWTNRLVGGWHAGTIFTVRSGIPVTPSTGADVALNGIFASIGSFNYVQRPNQTLLHTAAANKGESCASAPCVGWFNPAAFADPPAGTYGDLGFSTIRAPGFWEWDQSIYRDFRIREGQTLQVRAEAFNVTNSVRFYTPTVSLASGLFGNITSDYSTTGSSAISGTGGRVVQFAMKYVF